MYNAVGDKRPCATKSGSSPEQKKSRDDDNPLDDDHPCDDNVLPLDIAPFPATVTTDAIKKLLEDHAKDADKRTLQTITQAASVLQSEIVAINSRVKQNDSRTEKIEGNVAALQKTIEDLAKQVLELQSNQAHQKEKNATIEKSIAISDATPQARDGKSETKRDPDQYDKKVVCISAKNPIAKDTL